MVITDTEHQAFIKSRIAEIEKDLNDYALKRQAELDEFMRKTHITDFVQETNTTVAKYLGRIEALKELLPEEPKPELPASEIAPEAPVAEKPKRKAHKSVPVSEQSHENAD